MFVVVDTKHDNMPKTRTAILCQLGWISITGFLFKVNNRNTRKRCEICSKLTIKTPERLQ